MIFFFRPRLEYFLGLLAMHELFSYVFPFFCRLRPLPPSKFIFSKSILVGRLVRTVLIIKFIPRSEAKVYKTKVIALDLIDLFTVSFNF